MHGRPLGQHFLFDKDILNRTADTAGLSAGDFVLEVGPGLGTLTECLAARAAKVVAVELDAAFAERFGARTAGFGNVALVSGDILKIDIEELWRKQLDGRPFKIVANLPYYITTPIIMRFLESGLPVQSLTVMVQKEVADRLVSPPGSREYGAISVAVQYRTVARKSFNVPAGAFTPPPRVESAVLQLDVREKPAVDVADESMFRKVVKGCFSSRRKTLKNNISSTFGVGGEEAARILEACGISPGERAERLGLNEFAKLANKLSGEGFKG